MARPGHPSLELKNHDCDAAFKAHEVHETWSEYSPQGDFLCRCCPLCFSAKAAHYRREILSGTWYEPIKLCSECVPALKRRTHSSCPRCGLTERAILEALGGRIPEAPEWPHIRRRCSEQGCGSLATVSFYESEEPGTLCLPCALKVLT